MDHRVVERVRRGQAVMRDRTLADLLVDRGLLTQAETTALTAETPPGSLAERLISEEKISAGQFEALSQEMELLESLDTVVQDATPVEVREASQKPDTRVGKYVLTNKLGAGGMGEVWRAWDYGLGRWVALKFLKVQDSRLVSRFMREATLLARLAHPNITQVHEIGVHNGRPYLAMELVDGGAFGREQLDRREAAEVIRAAGLGVAHAHGKGIIHRDLKPSNLLRSSDGRIFVTDFGLARMRAEEGGLTVSGALLGTPSFMAPEQAQGRDADERTDVYGLGASLYALVEGKPPFEGEAAAEIVRRAAIAPPPSMSGRSDDLTVVAQKAMERDRRDRYQTVTELTDDLELYLADEPVAAQPISSVGRVVRRARRRPGFSAAIAAGTLLLLAATVWAGGQLNEARLKARADRLLGTLQTNERLHRLLVDSGNADSPEADALVEAMKPTIEEAFDTAPEYRRSLYYQGRLLNWSGELEAAEGVFSKLLEREPGYDEARVSRARNRLILALARYGWEPDPTVTTSLKTGASYEYENPPEEAARWIAEAARDFEALPDTSKEKIAGRGEVAFFLGEYEKCSELLRPVVEEIAYQNLARRQLLWCLLGTDGFVEAESQANYLISKDLFTQFAIELRAYALAGQQRFEEAIRDLDWLSSNDPERQSVFVPFWLAILGRYDDALARYETMLVKNPDSVRVFLDRSTLYYRMGEMESALADADRAIELEPNNPEAYQARASALPPGEEALAAHDRAVELAPDVALYRGQRGIAHLRVGNIDQAIADSSFAADREPEDATWHWTLGLSYANSMQWEPAERHLTLAIDLGAANEISFVWRGIARIEQQNCEGVNDLVIAHEMAAAIDAAVWDQAGALCGADYVAERQAVGRKAFAE